MNTCAGWIAELELYWQALDQAALQHLHIHLSGINDGPKGEKNHLVMEEADLDFKNLMRALHDSDDQGRILWESPVLEVGVLKFKTLWLKVSGEEQ